ncbi:MAG: metal-dependent phosphohydrolase [Melioribacteraceae bacterium]|nr:MAG: metal-dependent phosphohydrolase [Melioribacteraceae bacterium]
MLNIQKLVIESFVEDLKKKYREIYSILDEEYCNVAAWIGKLALENIANTDAPYHNLDHTIMVSSVGLQILKGKHILEGGVAPKDWLHFMLALLCHDIGFVRGICREDINGTIATGINEQTIEFPHAKSDAALMPYHVDRSKLFIRERFGNKLFADIDAEKVADYIEMTRFPIPDEDFYKSTITFGGLVRAADFIGQLGDPNYLRKIPALYYEFVETGADKKLNYKNPGQMRQSYAKFYWHVVNPYINDALKYLHVTQEGKQWVANLQSHVFDVEHNQYRHEIMPDFQKINEES